MKNRGLALGCMLPLLAACNTNSSVIHVTSDTVSQQQLDTIVNNIEQHYPDATNVQRQRAADVVVRAIEALIFVEGGSFDMGDFGAPCLVPSGTVKRMDWAPGVECLSSPSSTETGAHQLHKVTLDSYSISKFETRFIDMEWMRQLHSMHVASSFGPKNLDYVVLRDSEWYKTLTTKLKNTPASTKTWQEAKDYCQWLGSMSGLPFDLPTEAQWEYAARSRGQKTYFATNNGYRQVSEDVYIDPTTNSYVEYNQSQANASTGIEDVDTFPPNPLGVYGMSNQVSEWVNDWYSPDYYINSPEHNPQGPETGTEKVLRDAAGVTMTFARIHHVPAQKEYYVSVSFRCALQSTTPIH
ncbi:SUMF1/EgtB/PvdO family nonheme iron enzyme [Vibrio neptunius]|uniref:formylglycine-generating enzyme family protein n=1 Tax=Vibrio neptunius TaxID=170651 RepID=UPI0033152743